MHFALKEIFDDSLKLDDSLRNDSLNYKRDANWLLKI